MAGIASETLVEARDALARHAWQEAYDLLVGANAAEPLEAADLEGLASASWWTGRLDACIAARERAFAGYSAAAEPRRAALVAIAVAKDYFAKRSASVGAAWVGRAERLLAGETDCVEQGYLERLLGVIALEGEGDYESALAHAKRALEFATAHEDRELQAIAVHDQGRALVAMGNVAEGMGLIDEATVAAVSGELSPYHTGVVYCNTITACKEIADYRRAGDWSEAAKRWCERQAIAGFPGMCRVYRASIMLIRGAWADAELEARRACDELLEFNVGYAAEAFYELGEVRMRRGDLTGARESFERAHALGRDPQPGLALLQLAEGKPEAASAALGQALAEENRPLHRAQLLPVAVEVALAAGDVEGAQEATAELTRIAGTYGTEALLASAAAAGGRVALSGADVTTAVREARRAVRAWQEVDAPFEAGQSRILLAEGYRAAGDAESAIMELQAAAATFDQLGAIPGATRARELLASLGAAPRAAGAETALVRTFMFTDIVGSTPLIEAIGDEAWTELLGWHDQTLRPLFAAHGGEEIHHGGDGFFIAFARPLDAIECAVSVQRTLQEHRRLNGFAPSVRIGIHAADATRNVSGYQGRGVHTAARIGALAEGGQIVVSARTLDGVPLPYSILDRKTAELKGVSEPVEIASLEWRT